MAALFTGASTQYLVNSAPGLVSTGYPFSIGMWVRLTAIDAVARTVFGFSDTGTTSNYLIVRMTATETIGVVARAGGTESANNSAIALVAGTWNFVLAQFISATNRRLWVWFDKNTQPTSLQGTTSRAPTGLDTLTLGALSTSGGITEPWDGMIAEYWLANATYEDAAGTILNVLPLALGGPFSIPRLAKDIIEYRSFRQHPASDGDTMDDVFHGALGRQTWVNTNGVTTSHHPPLPYWYVKPSQTQRVLTV